MKNNFSVFLLLVLLISCNNFPLIGATNTPQPTLTLTPTFTPTITPTITLTPTATPDPNMPPDATGKDPTTGKYTKTVDENGKSEFYYWKQFQFGDDSNNGIKGHWFKSWMANGPINLTKYEGDCSSTWGGELTLNMNVYAIEGQTFLNNFGELFKPDRTTEFDKYKNVLYGGLPCHSISLPITILEDIFYRYLNLPQSDSPITRNHIYYDQYMQPVNHQFSEEQIQKEADDRQALLKALNDGTMKIKIGDDEWSPRNGYEVYWIEESMAANDPTFLVGIHTYTIKGYYLKLTVEDGRLIAFLAPTKWLTDEFASKRKDKREAEFKTMILRPLEGAINGIYPFENAGFFSFWNYAGEAGPVSGNINGGQLYKFDTPFIDFTDDP